MRRYLRKLSVFVLLLFSVLLLADYVYSALIRRSDYLPAKIWEDILEGGIRADIVALGSSRTWVHVDPRVLDSVLCTASYNLGFDGSPVNRQVQKYGIFTKRNPKPRVLIQNIDCWTLDYLVGYAQQQFYPFFWEKDIRRMFFPSEPFSFCEKYIPFFRYHGINPRTFFKNEPHSMYKGYLGQNLEWNGEAFKRQESIEFAVSDTSLGIFDSFLSRTKEDGVSIVFVYAPLYDGALQKITDIDRMRQIFQSFADRYEIPVLDYSDMWLCSDTTFFYNAMHLNKRGAGIFTDSLANDIRRLGLL